MLQRATVVATLLAVLLAPRPAAAQRIEEGYFASINGVEQWITIRGNNPRNPILLFLHGGPGIASSTNTPVFAAWEEVFTIVQWDQPLSAATYAKNAGRDMGPITIDRYTRDGIAVIEHVLRKMNANKVVVMGASWGSILGLTIADRRPDVVAAYVGTGQVVSGARGTAVGHDLALEAAQKRGDATAVATLERIGRPPYKTFDDYLVRQQYTNLGGQPPSPEELAALAKVGPAFFAPPAPDATYVPRALPLPDPQTLLIEAVRALYSEVLTFDASSLGLAWEIPMFCFQGERDINTPTVLAREYFASIKAPAKEFVVIPGAGHATMFFADDLLRLLNVHVRPLVIQAAAPR